MPNVSSDPGPGADDPASITHSFSFNHGHVAWAAVSGKHPLKNGKLRMRRGWYGVGLSPVSHTGVWEDKRFRTRYPDDYPGFQSFYMQRGCLVGAVYVSHSLPHSACESDECACASYPIKNIVTKCINLNVAIPCRVLVGTWPLADDARVQLRDAIREHLQSGHAIHLTGAEKRFPPDPAWESRSNVAYEDAGTLPPAHRKRATRAKERDSKPIRKAIQKSKLATGPHPESKKPLVAATSPAAGGAADIRQFFGGR